jgi:hypothetical protein
MDTLLVIFLLMSASAYIVFRIVRWVRDARKGVSGCSSCCGCSSGPKRLQ